MKRLLLLTLVAPLAARAASCVALSCPTDSLDEFRAMAVFAKAIGATHLDACQIEPSLWQWNQDRNDPYPNWSMYRPTIFKFIVPDELKAYLPADYAARNLQRLRERAAVLKEFGLKSAFSGMEPAYLPEQAYLDHPEWRGPRCDQARRARTEYYAPCLDDPGMRAIYLRTVTQLCRICPFDRFELRSNDSGSGFCWVQTLYPGMNGPDRCWGGDMATRVVAFMSLLQSGAAQAGLPDTKVNIRANFGGDGPAIRAALRPGQSINNTTKDGTAAVCMIGFPNPFADYCAPIFAITRLAFVAEQLQRAQEQPGYDWAIGLRSPRELDLMKLLEKYVRTPIGRGPAARWKAVAEVAAALVGSERADELVEAWAELEEANKRIDSFYTGGHLFLLGTLHQRWLTRPLVAFPNELKGADRSYWRDFIFQAQTERDAENLLDLQANRWLSGYGGRTLSNMAIMRGALPHARRAAARMAALRGKGVDSEANRWLEEQAAKFAFYVCMMRNAAHAIEFQSILDRTDYGKAPEDETLSIAEQGDPRLDRINQIVRSEINNTHEMIQILERAPGPVVSQAKRPEEQTIMIFGPNLADDLKRKIRIMETHRRDFLRLYRSRNR